MSSSILSLGTAVPPYKAKQADLAEFMTNYMGLDRNHSRRLQVLYNLSGIETRYSVIPDFTSPDSEFRFFPHHSSKQPPSTQQRMALYQEHAVQLGTDAAKDCLANFNGSPPEITHLIAVSCTGMYAPGLDIDLVKSLELPTDIERTAINFMGCYAAFNALKAADKIVQTSPESNVLIVAVELCTIHFQPSTEEDAMVSNALFADGAGAAIVGRADNGQASLSMDAFYSDLFLDGQEDMGWYIRDFGFEMRLTAEVPAHIKKGIADLSQRLLNKINIPLERITKYAIHPGGKRILDVIEEELSIKQGANVAAREVMRNFGNMSSPSVLFALKYITDRLSPADEGEHVLSFAFGPGLTMESMLLTARNCA